jgi:dTDP-4-amino-4,6-dideoxygalactose transaminase
VYGYQNNSPSDFPVAAEYQNTILSIPIYPELADDDIGKVVDLILKFDK